jgi:PAS domain S-box-containing protein/diguanylate cyclase (GGDEF)-like protein
VNGDEGRSPTAFGGDVGAETRQRQLTTLLVHSPDAIVMLDAAGLIREWNPAAEALLGWSRTEILGTGVRVLVPPEDLAQFEDTWAGLLAGGAAAPHETVRVHRDGTRVPVRIHVAPIHEDGRFAGAVATYRNLPVADEPARTAAPGASSAAERRPEGDQPGRVGIPAESARDTLVVDELTGLPGRRGLQRRLAEPVAGGLARGVAVLDVDAFALINHSYGPDAGDDVLRELARRLQEVAGAAVVGRWQGDTFVYVVDAVVPAVALDELTIMVVAALGTPFLVGGDLLRLTVSAGLVTTELVPAVELLRSAMDALGAAKETGRDRAVWFDAAMRPAPGGGFRLANDLHHGIEQGELRLHFQPIVQLSTNEVIGVEALVRWERPGVGLLAPASFIDVAERTGQIVPLGAWVAQQACRAAVQVAPFSGGPRSVSINVSARQLSDPGLVAMLHSALQESSCPPSSIIIEVTETALMHDMGAATTTLEAIKALGLSLDLDDFGTGYSSLLYLKHFPVDRIKIDQSFVGGLGTDGADTAIVASTIALAHSVGMQAVAEGVETADQLALLHLMGCDFAQGYLLSRPLTFDQLHHWLSQYVPARRQPPEAQPEGPGSRPSAADQRDQAAEERDRAAEERDRAAEERDQVAEERDQVAEERDQVAEQSEAGVSKKALDRSALARRKAASDRTRAAQDRGAGAGERVRAEADRDSALTDRETSASERVRAEADRDSALTDRETSASERVRAEADRDSTLTDGDTPASDPEHSSGD